MSTHDADDLVTPDAADVPTDATTGTDATTASTETPDQSLTPEEEPTMSGTTPPRASAWTTDTSTLDQPVADETPTAAYTADPAAAGPATAPATAPAGTPVGTPVGTVPFPRTLDQPRGIRVGTVVWGLVVTAVAVGLLALANGATFDVQLAAIVVIAGAGLALLVGSLVGTRRRHG